MVAEQIRTALRDAVGKDISFSVERPNNPEHGDFASNAALVLAKKEGKNPREVAETLQKKLEREEFAIEIAGPGFLNFRVAPKAWQEQLQEILTARHDYGSAKPTGKKAQVEFISINPTGPLHVGHGRGAYFGDVLANVLARGGFATEREYYINDAGNQIETLGRALKGEEDAYTGAYFDAAKKKLDLAKDAATVGTAAADLFMQDIRKSIERMGISFDEWFSERKELRETKEIERALADLEKAGKTYEQDGALWLKTTEAGDDKDRVLRKSDGEYTYVAPDIAYHYHKFVKREFDLVVDVWGSDHHGSVKRLKAGVEYLREIEKFNGQLKIILIQMVRLIEGGKERKMSKRTGTYVTLDELLDEVPSDVARFFYVLRSHDTHMDFDLDLAKEQSQKNPVYYLKYAHARICSILGKTDLADEVADLSKLTEPAELALIRELSEFPAVIARTAEDYEVQRVPHYALALADAFHKFYEQVRVISDDEAQTKARLQLIRGTQIVLRNAADTIGIELPDKM